MLYSWLGANCAAGQACGLTKPQGSLRCVQSCNASKQHYKAETVRALVLTLQRPCPSTFLTASQLYLQ